ncbi:MAG: hypothetical protein V1664_00105 [Candidatus Uhrbacteria bacterium]
MRTPWYKILLMATVLLLAVGAAGRRGAGDYISNKVLTVIADRMVEEYLPSTKSVGGGSDRYGTFHAMGLVRGGMYDHYGKKRNFTTLWTSFMVAVNEAGKDPAAVKKFYNRHIDVFLSKVVESAQGRGCSYYEEGAEMSTWRPLTNRETAEMLVAYSVMAESTVQYLVLAGQPVSRSFQERIDRLASDSDLSISVRRQAELAIMADLATASDLPFSTEGGYDVSAGFRTWQFGMRRYESSPELLQAMIEIAQDVTRRTLAKAEEVGRRSVLLEE